MQGGIFSFSSAASINIKKRGDRSLGPHACSCLTVSAYPTTTIHPTRCAFPPSSHIPIPPQTAPFASHDMFPHFTHATPPAHTCFHTATSSSLSSSPKFPPTNHITSAASPHVSRYLSPLFPVSPHRYLPLLLCPLHLIIHLHLFIHLNGKRLFCLICVYYTLES